MKILIGAACIAVIALAIYVIGGDYMASRASGKQTFSANCDALLEEVKDIDPNKLSSGERLKYKQRLDDCANYLRTGKLPN